MLKPFRSLGTVIASVLILLGSFIPVRVSAEGEDFDEFLRQEWIAMMESDYTTMHYSVKDYKSMNLTKPEVTLGKIGYDYFEETKEARQASLDHLHTFDFDSLNETQKYDYLIYEYSLQNDVVSYSFPNYEEMFNPYNGLQDDLITTFTEFVFYAKEDIDDYLTLINDYPRMIDDMIAFTDEQTKQGYFMTDACLDTALEHLQEFVDKGEENPLIIIFEKNVDAFPGLTDEEIETYKNANREAVLNGVLPAVSKAIEFLGTKRGSRSIGDKSIASYPDGREYYNNLLKIKASENTTPQEAYDYLAKAVGDAMSYYAQIMISGLAETGSVSSTEQISDLSGPEEILDYLRAHMEGFPKGPDVTYIASYLDPSVANPSVGAYYLTTPIDDLTDNVIRINGENASDINTLYYTLAHEGFPGHLYQFTWYYNTNPNPIRHDLSVIGYSEGWAQYVERIMLQRSSLSSSAQESVALNAFFGYCMQAQADVAVNGLNYDEEKLKEVLAIDDDEVISELYTSVRDMPGQIIPYGYGFAKFWELRERCMMALGDDFNEEEFHLVCLTNGPRQFSIVESDLAKYVESKGKTLPTEFVFFGSDQDGDAVTGTFAALIDRYKTWIIIGGIVALIVIGLILFLIIRGIIALFGGGKKKRKKNPDPYRGGDDQ